MTKDRCESIKESLDKIENRVYNIDEVREYYKFEGMEFDYLENQAKSLVRELSGKSTAFSIPYILEKIDNILYHLRLIETAKRRLSEFGDDEHVKEQWEHAVKEIEKNPTPMRYVKVVQVK